MEDRIPKIIHYCWFGNGPLSDMAVKCIESWKNYCPDYEICRWDENNFDVNYCQYVKEAYEAKKWAFVSDVARLHALVNVGGIYLDTDVELLRPLGRELLRQSAFCGMERTDQIATAVLGSEKGTQLFSEMLNGYHHDSFVRSDGTLNTSTNVKRLTDLCKNRGFSEENKLQHIDGLTIFPIEFFSPKDWVTGKTKITANTYAIHHFDGSWWNEEQKCFGHLLPMLSKYFSERTAKRLARIVSVLSVNGVRGLIAEIKRRTQPVRRKKLK